MSNATDIKRSNKITAQFQGEGVVVGTFYKTHDKLEQVLSTDVRVITGGFVMPESILAQEGVEPVEVTPSMKLEAFRTFLQHNSALFGYLFDPTDRRPEANKFPSRYTPELLLEFSNKVLVEGLTKLADSAQKHIDSLVKQGAMVAGSALAISVGIGSVTIAENYKNGAPKYADVILPVTFGVNGKEAVIDVKVDLVSGQLRKPRELGTYVFTVTGLKQALVDHDLIVKVVKEEAPAVSDEVVTGEGMPEVAPAE